MIKFHSLVFLVGLLSGVDARRFLVYCDLTPQPVIQLRKDAATGEYHVSYNGVEETPGQDRSLSSNEMEPSLRGNFFGNGVNAIDVSPSRELNETEYDEGELIAARHCICSWNETVYCPVDNQYCGIPVLSSPNQIRACFNVNDQTIFARSIWLYVVVWIAILLSLLFFTGWGRTMLVALPGNCICGSVYLEFLADRMMERNPDLANNLIHRNLRRRRRRLMRRLGQLTGEIPPFATPVVEEQNEADLPNETAKPPTSLALRTKIYRSNELPSSPSNEGDDYEFNHEDTCAICVAPLEDGERVGALACRHDFHVNCIKQWLSRRNCCPVCRRTNVATPQYEETAHCEVATEDVSGTIDEPP
jgi:hypothetical protein